MVLWWLGNLALLVVVVPLVLVLANRIMSLGDAITTYADDIRTHARAVDANLEPAVALAETRELVGVAKGHAVRYVRAVGLLSGARPTSEG